MKKLTCILSIVSLFLIGACNNELDITAEPKDIPVVYGLISKINSNHYIRIERAFLDVNIPAEELAQDPNNYYYDNATVRLIKGGTDEIDLVRVNAVDEGFEREEGIFATDPNYVYKLEGVNFAGGQDIDLIIDRGEGLAKVTSTSKILRDIKIVNPSIALGGFSIPDNDKANIAFEFENDARIFDVWYRFNYTEQLPSDPQPVNKYIDIVVENNLIPDDEEIASVEFDGIMFYEILGNRLEAINNIVRTAESFEITVKGGGVELKEFISLQLANGGVTSSQQVPTYSNLSEGLGIFSSTFTTVEDFEVTGNTLENIKNNPLTSDLNFE